MSVATGLFTFDDSYARELYGLYEPWQASKTPAPRLLALNTSLAIELGLDPELLASPAGVEVLVGNTITAGSTPLAMAYAGHQFGGYSPRLGDGRALLLGEVIDIAGVRRDIHLKGSGRTPFSRGGDGKAVVGPMLREYVIGEAMHALGIPTTRALAVVATGDQVVRETLLPGAVLVRVAASHLRVGTFQYAAASGDLGLLRRLADYAIGRHHPDALDAPNPYLGLLELVVAAQAALVAQWMHVGFIHGVMNTDNTTISGETIDYGPCAFMDRFDPSTVFSSIDHGGRYAYGNQPGILTWNLARLAETLLPLIDDDIDRAVEAATATLRTFSSLYGDAFRAGMKTKLGVGNGATIDDEAISALLAMLQEQRADMTGFFRALSSAVRGDDAPARARLADPSAFDRWAEPWRDALPGDPVERKAIADEMDRVNPVYIPRNHLVEEALAAATDGDVSPLHQLVDAVTQPFEARPGFERYAEPAPDSAGPYRTFCGT